MNPDGENPTPDILEQMVISSWIAQSIYAAAKLGIADLLQEGPKTSDELAKATETHSPSLYRLLRALASFGIFAENEQGSFHLTPLANHLRSDLDGSVWATAILCGEPWWWQSWGNILHTLKTGEPAIIKAVGLRMFPFLQQNPEAMSIFSKSMSVYAAMTHAASVEAYDFSEMKTVVDVGGGFGTHLALLLKSNPHLRGLLFDLPPVAEAAKKVLQEQGVAERSEVAAGDFFEAIPAGGDAYILCHLLHDWDDPQALAILKNCRRVMKRNGRLLVVEAVVPPGNQPSPAKLSDLSMMIMMGGKERTEAEYRRLLEASGFHLSRMISTSVAESIIEGVCA